MTTREIGKLGEDIACKWLVNHGFLVVERNYLKKWGELDIVAAKDKVIHFIEVKSGTLVSKMANTRRLEENVHELKVRRLRRTIATYLAERRLGNEARFQFHVLTVTLNNETRRARVNFLENIVL
jgi:putative endonuclease